MSLIATVSTEQAAAALGLKPATVCKMIRTGQLPAARIGRSWRIGSTSLNALLAGAEVPAAPETTKPSVVLEQTKSAPCRTETTVVPAVPVMAIAAASAISTDEKIKNNPASVLFDADDMVWISRYRRDLSDPNPQIRADAKWHLERFAARAEQDPTRHPTLTAEQRRAAIVAISNDWTATAAKSRSVWF